MNCKTVQNISTHVAVVQHTVLCTHATIKLFANSISAKCTFRSVFNPLSPVVFPTVKDVLAKSYDYSLVSHAYRCHQRLASRNPDSIPNLCTVVAPLVVFQKCRRTSRMNYVTKAAGNSLVFSACFSGCCLRRLALYVPRVIIICQQKETS